MNHWNYNKDLGIDIKKELGNTNTHYSISHRIINDLIDFKLVKKSTRFLEPAVGAGSFYFELIDRLLQEGYELKHIVEEMIFAYDIDKDALDVLKYRLADEYAYIDSEKRLKVFNEDFLFAKPKDDFDYVVTNPPYISSRNIKPVEGDKDSYLDKISELNGISFDRRSDIYMLFYLITFNKLKPSGKQIFLCSDSWIDSEFGEGLRKLICNTGTLSLIVNSQLFPFFRDDTNAIITVIERNTKATQSKIISMSNKISECENLFDAESYEISRDDLNSLFANEKILNKRNALVIHGKNYFKNTKLLEPYFEYFSLVRENINVTNTGVSQSFLEQNNMIAPNDGTATPVFWQIQARINRKPNYKNRINAQELAFQIKQESLNQKLEKNIKEQSIYLSGIIDRFPLAFYMEGKSFHTSKYMHLESSKLDGLEICLSLNNIFSIFNMELQLKEGTRKTLRSGEMGLTKEIKKSDLENLLIVDFTKFSKSTRDAIYKIGSFYQDKIIYNIEEALLDRAYMQIQELIKNEIGMTDAEFRYVKDEALRMYYFRMRNFNKLKIVNSEACKSGSKKMSQIEMKNCIKRIKNSIEIVEQNKELILSKDIKKIDSFKSEAGEMMSLVMPLFFIGGDNYIHNHKYRELALTKAFTDFIQRVRNNSMHGADLIEIPKAECKSMSIKSRKLKINGKTMIGQIDKVYNKLNNADEIYAENTEFHLVCGIFEHTSARPIIVFYIDNNDFGKTIQPLLRDTYGLLEEKSKGLTKKSRDSLTLKLEDFINCPSLQVITVNDNWENSDKIEVDMAFVKRNRYLKKSLSEFNLLDVVVV